MSSDHSSPDAAARLRRARFVDRLARRLITVGGVAVLGAVIAIFLFIGYEVVPLLGAPAVKEAAGFDAPGNALAITVEEYREVATVVSTDGYVRTFNVADGRVIEEVQFEGAGKLTAAIVVRRPQVILAVDDKGQMHHALLESDIQFDDDGKRTVRVDVTAYPPIEIREDGGGLSLVGATLIDEEKILGIATGPGFAGRFRFRIEDDEARVVELPGLPEGEDGSGFTCLDVANFQDEFRLYAGHESGLVYRWDAWWTDDPELIESIEAGDSISDICVILGEETLVTAARDRTLSAWFGVRATEDAAGWNLTRIRDFDAPPAPITHMARGHRDKTFLAADAEGHAWLVHNTTGRTLIELPQLPAAPAAVTMAPKNDGVLIADVTGAIHHLAVKSEHPETTFETLFLPVWYEGAVEPDLKWQSTGGEGNEPKLSLTVLVFGSLKGVLYALVFSVPIAVLAAIYTALFLPGRLRAIIKPAIEILAAIPSVVVGLLCALWLSPIVEEHLTAVFLLTPAFILAFGLFLVGWSFLPRRKANRILNSPWLLGVSFGTLLVPFVIGLLIGPAFEDWFLGGNVQVWLDQELGMIYDPRNAMVVGFALGFAVVPVIFTIAEDSIMNVPRSLLAASEALGATRWQTTWRVVVPAAAPGIFAALMLGFGRAVGETMIVLMATGNTPLLDISPFNGMRTISACIAVEVPEAPHGGTLYRVLFLSGVLLFAFTFLCNTVAEMVGHRLRAKYGRF